MTHDSLAAALAAFQAEMPTVHKSQTATVPTKAGGSYKYTYAGLASVTTEAMPILAKHGLSFACLPGRGDDGSLFMTGRLLHTSGESLEGVLPIRGATPQEIGAALTYMRRYLLGCLTGLVTDDDTDGMPTGAARRKVNDAPRTVAPNFTAPAPRAQDARTPQGLDPITHPQLKALHAALNGAGITERDEALAYYAATIGHDVASSKDLTKAEASRVIDSLQPRGDVEPLWSEGGAS